MICVGGYDWCEHEHEHEHEHELNMNMNMNMNMKMKMKMKMKMSDDEVPFSNVLLDQRFATFLDFWPHNIRQLLHLFQVNKTK